MHGKHDEVTERIIKVFYEVYNELGYGFLESVYREAMKVALEQEGLHVKAEQPIHVHFRLKLIGVFRGDLIVNDAVLVELKTCDAVVAEHGAQTMNYLRATSLEVALLMNFGPTARFKRFAMDNHLKRSVTSALIGVR